jgi:hypothetical protein
MKGVLMLSITHNNEQIDFTITPNNIHIYDSCRITKKDDMLAILKSIREVANEQNITYKRTDKSWLAEWRAHNFLFEKEVEEGRTASVDLNEDETPLRLFLYRIISLFY